MCALVPFSILDIFVFQHKQQGVEDVRFEFVECLSLAYDSGNLPEVSDEPAVLIYGVIKRWLGGVCCQGGPLCGEVISQAATLTQGWKAVKWPFCGA